MRTSVVARRDAPPVLEFGEEVLDLVTLLVERLVVGIWNLSAAARGDAGLDALCLQGFPEGLTVIAPVGNQRFCSRQYIQHQTSAFMVAHLAFAEQHDDRASLAIADSVQLGVQHAFGSPDTAGNIPLFTRLA